MASARNGVSHFGIYSQSIEHGGGGAPDDELTRISDKFQPSDGRSQPGHQA